MNLLQSRRYGLTARLERDLEYRVNFVGEIVLDFINRGLKKNKVIEFNIDGFIKNMSCDICVKSSEYNIILLYMC